MSNTKLTPEEKKQAIETFIQDNQGKYLLYKSVQQAFSACGGDTLSTWVKGLYGEKAAEFFLKRGVILPPEQHKAFTIRVLDALKGLYQSKTPAADFDTLIMDNPALPIYDIQRTLRYDDRGALSLRLIDDGIVQNPFQSDQRAKRFIEDFLQMHIMTKPRLSLVELRREIMIKLPEPFGEALLFRLFDRFPEIFGSTAEAFFVDQKKLVPPEEAAAEAKKSLRLLAKAYVDPESRVSTPSAAFFKTENYSYTTSQLIDYYLYEAEKKGLFEEAEAEAYVTQVFVDAGIVKGKMTEAAEKARAKEDVARDAKKQEIARAEAAKAEKLAQLTKTDLYSDPDKIDVDALCAVAGLGANAEYPADKTYKVDLCGKPFRIKLGLKRTLGRLEPDFLGYAAEKEYKTMLSKEEVIAELDKEDPNRRSDAVYFATAKFLGKYSLGEDEILRRFTFLKAVGVRLSDPAVLAALADFAPKKKNGTFNRKAIVRVASSMVALLPNEVVEITGRPSDDTTLVVSFEAAKVDPDNLEKSRQDFVSTYWNLFMKES